MTEENVTLAILEWLEGRGWTILSYDFPQSGTGIQLSRNGETGKGKNSIIPDVIAHKGGRVVLFENKEIFSEADFIKVQKIRSGEYSQSIEAFLERINVTASMLLVGIGLPWRGDWVERARDLADKTDFIVFVHDDKRNELMHGPNDLFD